MQIDWTAYAARARRPLSERGTVTTRWRDRQGQERTTEHGAEITADLALCAVEAQFAGILSQWQVIHRATGLLVVDGKDRRRVRALLLALQGAGINWAGWAPEDGERARAVIASWREWAGVGA